MQATRVNAPIHNHSQTGWYSIYVWYSEWMEGWIGLSVGSYTEMVCLSAEWHCSCKSNTYPNCCTTKPPFYFSFVGLMAWVGLWLYVYLTESAIDCSVQTCQIVMERNVSSSDVQVTDDTRLRERVRQYKLYSIYCSSLQYRWLLTKLISFFGFYAITILSVCLFVTRVDQSKTVQARITKFSPSAVGKTLVSGTVKLFHKFEGVYPERARYMRDGLAKFAIFG